jgi:acyl-coenzyme A thioesterase 7
MMGPDDTQMFGLVHGGSIMQVIEEAGTILSTQYCNRIGTSLETDAGPPEEIVTVSACVEKIKFMNPMLVGDLAEVHAEIGYTSPHSVQVIIDVYARSIAKAKRKLSAQAKLWYVPLTRGKVQRVANVPPRTYTRGNPRVQEEGRVSYERLKELRQTLRTSLQSTSLNFLQPHETYAPEPGTVAHCTAHMAVPIHPSSCWAGERYMRGGVVMKWMDECASLAGTFHTTYYCYTAAVDTIVFLRKAFVGSLLAIRARPIFIGKKSMDVQITVDELVLDTGKKVDRNRMAEAFFTFFSFDENRNLRDFPPLKLITDEEKELNEQRRKLYEQRKADGSVI